MVEYERRRTERELYGTLRALAKVHMFTSFASLVGGILSAAIFMAFAPAPGPAKLATMLILLVYGGAGFFLFRAQAQMIYIMFDIARDSRVSRELLEKTPAQ